MEKVVRLLKLLAKLYFFGAGLQFIVVLLLMMNSIHLLGPLGELSRMGSDSLPETWSQSVISSYDREVFLKTGVAFSAFSQVSFFFCGSTG